MPTLGRSNFSIHSYLEHLWFSGLTGTHSTGMRWLDRNQYKGRPIWSDRFSDKHNFVKPNDVRALKLMDHAARDIMEEYPDIVLGFGESDEFRFVMMLVIISLQLLPTWYETYRWASLVGWATVTKLRSR
jgi:hypothetical protein